MRRSSAVLLAMATFSGCGRDESDLACPRDTKPYLVEGRTGARSRRMCMLPDGVTSHGPLVEIDSDGREHLVGRTIRGQREGRFVEAGSDGLTVEAFYRDGVVHGTFAIRRANGVLLSEQAFADGRRHGARREWDEDGKLRALEHYDRGVPTGEWMRDVGGVRTTRVYGMNGNLLSIDGMPLPNAPDTLALPDGSSLSRAECVRRAGFVWDGTHPPAEPICLDLFEEVQRCADDACRSAAVSSFANRR